MDVYTTSHGGVGILRVTQNQTTLEYIFGHEIWVTTFWDRDGGKLVSETSDPADEAEINACVCEAIRKVGGIPWGDPRNRVVPITMLPCIPGERFEDVLDYIRDAE